MWEYNFIYVIVDYGVFFFFVKMSKAFFNFIIFFFNVLKLTDAGNNTEKIIFN